MRFTDNQQAAAHETDIISVNCIDMRGESSDPADAVAVAIRGGMLSITLRDGRVIGNPIAWYPFLEQASAEQLATVELWWSGIIWPELNEGLEIKWMLLGKSESFD